MKKMKRLPVVIVCIAVAGIIGVVLFTGALKKKKELPSVTLASAVRGPLQERISASGSFQAERYSVVSSQTVGIVKKVYVKPGDHVEKGDLIIVVDERDARESLASAEIALEETSRSLAVELASLRSEIRKASLDFDQTRRAFENAKSLRAVDGLSEEEYLKASESYEHSRFVLSDANDRLRVAQGLPSGQMPSLDTGRDGEIVASAPSWRKAKLAMEGASRVLEGCMIRAEGPGTVTVINVAPGDRLLVETVVARIEDPSSVMAGVNVDEVDIGKIHEGMKAEITADSILGRTLEGTVHRVWPIVKNEGNGRVCVVQIALALSGEKLLSGASCIARITSVVKDEALTVPASALIPGAKPSAVWVAVESGDVKPGAGDAGAAAPVAAENAASAVADAAPVAADAVPAAEDAGAAPGDAIAEKSKAGAKEDAPKAYKLERREIKIGESTVSTIEILSGLAEGELVAIDMLPVLSEGMSVRNGSGRQ